MGCGKYTSIVVLTVDSNENAITKLSLSLMLPTYLKLMNLNTFVRIRGGGEDDKRANEVPYLNNIRLYWHGLPMVDFAEKILHPLQNGLACIIIGKATLLDTALEKDPAGRLGNPLPGAASPIELEDHRQRVCRLFSVILVHL